MPLRISFGFPDPGIDNGGKPRSGSRLERTYNFLLVVYRLVHTTYWLVVGGFLTLLPWQSFWENNYFVYRYPGLRLLMINPLMKGAVCGLGIVNLLIGLQEIVHFRKGNGGFLSR